MIKLLISLFAFSLCSNLFSQIDVNLNCSKSTVLISLRDSIFFADSKSGKIFDMPKEKLFGTGFLLYDDILGTNSVYLITNKHIVIDGSTKKFYDQVTLNLKSKVFSEEVFGLLGSPLPLVKRKEGKIGVKMYNELVDTSEFSVLWRDDTSSYSDLIVAKMFYHTFSDEDEEDGISFINKPIKLSNFITYDSILVGNDIFSFGFSGIIKQYKDDSLGHSDFPTNYPTVLCPGRVIEKVEKQQLIFDIGTFECRSYLVLDMPALGGQSGSPIFLEKNGKIYLAGVFSGTFNDYGWKKGIGWPIDVVYRIIERNKDYFINLK